MIGILLMSHGKMAEGMLNSCKLFFGDELESIESLCLLPDTDISEFSKKIEEKVKELDTGSGVIGFCDMFGGTPSNLCAKLMNNRFQVVTGVNLPMLLETLGTRLTVDDVSNFDFDSLIQMSNSSFRNLNNSFKTNE